MLEYILYLLIGTYTMGVSEGIYVYKFNMLTGESEYVSMAKADNPSYLTLSLDGQHVYAVAENGNDSSYASAFGFDKKKGILQLMNQEKTYGGAPCNIVVDSSNRMVVTANYTGGNISVFPLSSDGSLKPASQIIQFEGSSTDPRQQQPHLHCVIFSPDQKYLFATDLGTDLIYRYEVNQVDEGDLLSIASRSSVKVADGSGPRHLVFHPFGNYAYLINELSGKICVFTYNNGVLQEIQAIDADSCHAQGSADIRITPDGQYLYASNRLENDGLAIFQINLSNGKLTPVGYQTTGIHPRNFTITPNGKYLLVACRDSNLIQVFEINYADGSLQHIGQDIRLDSPVCLKFVE